MNARIDYLVTLLGTATAAAMAAMFAFLVMQVAKRIRRRRDYRTTWSEGWTALAVGYVARFAFIETVGDTSASAYGTRMVLLAFAAHFASLLGVGLFAFGSTLFARSLPRQVVMRATAGSVLFYSLIATLASPSLPALVLWESPLMLVLFGWAGATLLMLPDARRSPRSSGLAIAFAVSSLLWAAWFGAFGLAALTGGFSTGPFGSMLRFHAYLEAASLILLGITMLGVAMEQTGRELADVTEALNVAHDQVRRAELYDLKTGCLNERAFNEQVGLEVARGAHGAILVCDIDGMHRVNSEHGPLAGDELLWHCAQVLRGSIRPTDRLFRWRGDEFVLILPGASVAEVLPRFEKIIADAWPLRTKLTRGPLKLRASLGGAEFATVRELPGAVKAAEEHLGNRKPPRTSGSLRIVIND
ncbi:MAG: GGDEF domain-containing protein [Gemmatimonadota bacterium]|nr:GGDEF domain-containing protein [Gemmatimonadota bacterium]